MLWFASHLMVSIFDGERKIMFKRISRLAFAAAISAGALFCLVAGFAHAQSVVHGAWSVDCKSPVEKGKARCVASQKVATDPAGRKVVLGVIVEPPNGETKARISFRMTNKAFMRAGVAIKIDDNSPARLSINGCDEKVCEARGWLTDAVLRQMRGGRLLRYAFYIDQKNQITYPVSLDGFDAAFKEIEAAR
jgi:invasion protein IalB